MDKLLSDLKALKGILPAGGQTRISELTGIKVQLISQIFAGKQVSYVSDDTRRQVFTAAIQVIEDEIKSADTKKEVLFQIAVASH